MDSIDFVFAQVISGIDYLFTAGQLSQEAYEVLITNLVRDTHVGSTQAKQVPARSASIVSGVSASDPLPEPSPEQRASTGSSPFNGLNERIKVELAKGKLPAKAVEQALVFAQPFVTKKQRKAMVKATQKHSGAVVERMWDPETHQWVKQSVGKLKPKRQASKSAQAETTAPSGSTGPPVRRLPPLPADAVTVREGDELDEEQEDDRLFTSTDSFTPVPGIQITTTTMIQLYDADETDYDDSKASPSV
ncbi:uncharacterized protein L969DRAFT_91345 [Mixia osmundae IAM 14324]|uniref:Uncharacterized protein n=1 Tax=Mixia osmundae (strain CBS 9802 / IAM 14324 / JCM 22182 / KY 12970) TaxID=764103 RepID=G7E3R2_MIXOS|nr:uncharacterized protein L969DRAFT_91345 [Mixia osmundae IAM 14324]KEI41868.1 hypothetical protein L969DRAFT_91345 [Mixia osmundae IAM 14324]GAA97472.1 hypothetical protein E5Q_04151 [Mixia osmundae IAM 14324]